MLQEKHHEEEGHICMNTVYDSTKEGEQLSIGFGDMDDVFNFFDVLEQIAVESE